MTRLIDADKLKEVFENLASDDYNEPIWYQQTVFETIDNAPTVEERQKGKWIYKEFDVESGISRSYWCSNCGEPKSQWCVDFCQRCGADMKEADHEHIQ